MFEGGDAVMREGVGGQGGRFGRVGVVVSGVGGGLPAGEGGVGEADGVL